MQWYKCPHCGKNLFMLRNGAIIRGMEIKCRQCRKIVKVNVSQ